MSKKRLEWIDIAKGIAIICVVVGHVVASYHESGIYLNNTWWNFFHQVIYSVHMPLFVLLSGILFSLSNRKDIVKRKIIKKIIDYGIPYVTFSVLWVLMKAILSPITNNPVSVTDLVLIGVYPISFMWYIYALLIMQIIQIIFSSVSGRTTFNLVHIIIAGGYFLQPYLANEFTSIRFSDCIIDDILRVYIFFLIGVYGGKYLIKNIDNINNIKTCVINGLIFIGANVTFYYIDVNAPIFLMRLFDLMLALIGALFIIAISNKLSTIKHQRVRDTFITLGRYSLPIYVLQGIIIAATRILLSKMGLNDSLGIIPMFVCTVFGTVMPLIVYYISTKIWKFDVFFYPGKYLKL